MIYDISRFCFSFVFLFYVCCLQIETIKFICQKPSLYFADFKGNGIKTLLNVSNTDVIQNFCVSTLFEV